MIEKIFIPTVNRVDNQITYNILPEQLQKKVVFVVQKWEREKYKFDAEYMVLPDYITLNYSRPLSETKRLIYEVGKDMKYALLDDDISFRRRNAKYWTGISNMEKSKQQCNDIDILEMFDLYSDWLDESEVTVCGCGHVENPPSGSHYSNNTSLSSALWINGKDFADILSELKLTETRVAQDVVFLLALLTRGYGNRVSQEFCFSNHSVHKKLQSDVWDKQTKEKTLVDHKTIEKMFPGIFEIRYDESGNRQGGGFRNFGKSRIHWSKAYKSSQIKTLEKFYND